MILLIVNVSLVLAPVPLVLLETAAHHASKVYPSTLTELVPAAWDSTTLPPLVLSLTANLVEVDVEFALQLSLIDAYPAFRTLIWPARSADAEQDSLSVLRETSAILPLQITLTNSSTDSELS